MNKSQKNIHSYDVGKNPYKHDEKRGKWNSMLDFYLSCIGHSFGSKNFNLPFDRESFSVLSIITQSLTAFLITIPIYFLQSVLGQFSSSGFISVFRFAPIFKGIGYVALGFNIISVMINGVHAAILLIYFGSSFAPDLPFLSCGHSWNTPNCSMVNISNTENGNVYLNQAPIEFLENHIEMLYGGESLYPWSIFGSLLVIWPIIALISINGINSIGKILRYTALIPLGILVIVFIRCLCLPGVLKGLFTFDNRYISNPFFWTVIPISDTHTTLGSGLGSILTLASFNPFKSDTLKYSVLISLIMVGINFSSDIVSFSMMTFLRDEKNIRIYMSLTDYTDFPFIIIPYFLFFVEAAHFWSILFYAMLFISDINAVAIQMFTIHTAVFDEYPLLRNYKQAIIVGSCGAVLLLSTLFLRFLDLEVLILFRTLVIFTQMGIIFIELIIVLWIYGRLRFQRDAEFMWERIFSTWKFFIIRFVTPPCILLNVLLYGIFGHFAAKYTNLGTFASILFNILPWIIIPGFAIYKIATTFGTLKNRLKFCIRPTDWYPVEPEYRQEYEEKYGRHETAEQLIESTHEENEFGED